MRSAARGVAASLPAGAGGQRRRSPSLCAAVGAPQSSASRGPVGSHRTRQVLQSLSLSSFRGATPADERLSRLRTRALPESASDDPSPSGDEALAALDEAGPRFLNWPQRWVLVAATSTAFVLCNMDKVNMSVALIPMAADFGWSGADKGLVSSAFFWGYALTQVPAGYIASKMGGARVLLAGVLLWSFGTLLAPPASSYGLWALCASRLLVGLGEGVAPSAATALLVQFVPVRERARAVSLVWGGLDVGSVVGLLVAPVLIAAFGWQSVFYAFAVAGFVWCALWPYAQPHASVSVAALAAAEAAAAAPARPATAAAPAPAADRPRKRTPWLKFLQSPAVWAVVTTHFCFNYGYYTLLAWLPSYFEGALGLSLGASSTLSLLPYVAMVVMTPVVGPVADACVGRVGVTAVRKLAQGLSFLGPALCMLALAALTPASPATVASASASLPLVPAWLLGAASTAPPTALVVALMSLAFGLSAWSRAGLYCNHQDLSPRYASILLGVSNTAGALPGVLGVWAAGVLLDATGSWALALFLPTAAAQLLGTLVFTAFGSGELQGWEEEDDE